MNTSRRKSLALLIVALAAELFTLPVWAQAAQLEEVVVTARKRDESFRDVPVTVDVLTEAQIQSAGIQDPRDYVAMVPNMTMVEVQNIGNAFITIRGISQARNSEPSVAVLVDGVLETNPYEFNQELIDVRQIEVLKGPQGALYGRNAIGGAIIIHTKDPPEKFEGQAMFGVGNDDAYRGELALGGPMNSDGSLRYRASFAAYSSDGYLQNVYLNRKADPVREYSGRLRFLWKASDAVTADLRVYANRYETTAYYYIIPRADEANPFSSFTTPPNANDVTSPIQVNNEGSDNRDIFDTALKLDFDVGGHGTITSISDYTQTKEIDTGDAYDFRPIDTSIYKTLLGFDLNQSQFINVKAWSQELRYTSNKIGNFSWIGGVYYVHTERFISTGNMVDTGNGVFPVYETPRIGGLNPSATFLADSQNNNAWAVFADA